MSEDAARIKVYVRKGDSDAERRINFHWQGKIPALDLLERGYAIDGTQACESVIGTPETVMPVLLRKAELKLIAMLREFGYVAEFT